MTRDDLARSPHIVALMGMVNGARLRGAERVHFARQYLEWFLGIDEAARDTLDAVSIEHLYREQLCAAAAAPLEPERR